ncbi:alcohol dehydrogenase catalytic domain-containing protein [Novosphingobium rosa]|uniref:alcohol dehydrogenase catalytic domain-containing protein n=1 Tax=Novosphingobium rosa TaxID=76978 RepID=UPI000832492A|nr:zinc-binding dehydrogenase [Novosphingobium rosa]
MRAALFHEGRFSIQRLAEPSPGAGHLLVRPIACGICGSDLSIRKDAPHLCDVLHRAGFRGFMDPAQPVVMGHEFVCEVLDRGKDARKFAKGQRLVALPFLQDARGGLQLLGYSNAYNGAFAEMMLIDEASALPVPDVVDDDLAALTEPLAVAVHAVAAARPDKDCAFGVVGCGPVGLFVIARLKALGLGPVIAIEPDPARRALAEQLGADVVTAPDDPGNDRWWAGQGLPVGLSDAMAVDPVTRRRSRAVIFDCVGKPGLLMGIARGAPVGATIIGIGTCKDDDRIEPAFLLQKGLCLHFVFAYSPAEFGEALAMIARAPGHLAAMVSRQVGLGDLDATFDALARGGGDVKVLVRPDL